MPRYGPALLVTIIVSTLMLVCGPDARAQSASQFFALEKPSRLTLRLFAAGYGAEKYGTSHEGLELDQTVTHEVSLVARAIAYHVYQGTGFDSPLTPSHRSAPRDFGRFEGGVSFLPLQGTTFTLLGGEDIGDSHAPIFENDLSTWYGLQSRHPVNLAYSSSHYFQNGVTNGLIDLRVVAMSTRYAIVLLGVGGAIWGGGSVGQAKGQGGPDLGLFLRDWRIALDLQAGYGSSRAYGMMSLSHSIGWEE
jgi:hypothetical protein